MSDERTSLHRSIEAAKSLRLELSRLLAGEDDPQALSDTFDGETTLDAEIRSAVLAIEEDEIFIAGCKEREEGLKARRTRLEKRVEVTRGLIEQAMTVAEWTRLEMDIGTITLGKAAPRIEIDEESQIPTQFWRRQDPALDRAGLGRVLKERQKKLDEIAKMDLEQRAAALKALDVEMPAIPGCHLEVGGPSLTIRRS